MDSWHPPYGFPGMAALAPDWPAQIDLVWPGQSPGPGPDGPADCGPLKGPTQHEAANRAHTGPYSGTAQGAISRGMSAACQGQRGEADGKGKPVHGQSP